MNRKQKIIVSITGIFLVLMILVGLTYAYFLTKITGNINEKSISVTTANLVLEYGENTNVVQGISNAEPGYSVEKIFTATNKGNSTITYGAALENIVNGLSRQEDLVYTLTCTSYLKKGFSLSSDGSITGTVDGTCNGVSTETKFPSTSDLSIMVNNTIDTTHTQAYKLTITYKEMNVDQSEDMGKTFSAKVNIVDLNSIVRNNPYEANKNSLAYNIINNAMNKTNGTELLSNPLTRVAEENSFILSKGTHIRNLDIFKDTSIGYGNTQEESESGLNIVSATSNIEKCNIIKEKHISNCSDLEPGYTEFCTYIGLVKACETDGTPLLSGSSENTLSISSDDYGISYYYRGGVEDNYVNFAGMCWRIVRINGDGSTKLILEEQDSTCASSNGNWSIASVPSVFSSSIDDFRNTMDSGFKNFQSLLETKIKTNNSSITLNKYLKAGDWCLVDADLNNGGGGLYSESYYRLESGDTSPKEPTLKCNGTILNKYKDSTIDMYIGALTIDELLYAGISIDEGTDDIYLSTNESNNFYTLSSRDYASGDFEVYSFNTSFGSSWVGYSANSVRPSIQLKNGITISSGNGTKENPYEIAS